jgi:hypothetical protein
MKTLRILSILTISLLIVISCKKDQEIIGITPNENTLEGFKTDTISFETYSVLSDSIPSSSGTTKFMGAYHSDEMGLINSQIYTSFIPTEIGKVFPGGLLSTQKVSILLSISESYGTPFNQEFEVIKTTESITTDKTYYTKDSLSHAGEYLGSFTLNSKDTGTFEFPLELTLGNQILLQGTTNFASEALFLESLKGILIRPINTPGNNSGVLYGIRANELKINIIFSDENSNLDTITLHQPTSTKTFYQVKQSNNGSLFASGIDKPSEGNQQFYLQGIGGAKAKINFPNLTAWYNKRLINKATLVLPVQNSANTEFSKPSNLTFHPISNSTSTGIQSSFDDISNSYKFEIHNTLIQDLEAKKTLSYNISVLNANIHPEQVIISGNKNTSTPAKLIIYYTEYK